MARARLHRLAEETGGRSYSAPRGGPAGIFSQIEEELRTMYVLGFRVPDGWQDGKPHKLEVKSKRRGVELRMRKQYVTEATASPNCSRRLVRFFATALGQFPMA